jgi:tetratricopeptide (TPR) repeat protein
MTTQTIQQVLVVSENENLKVWISQLFAQMKLPWRMRHTCTLRATAPDFKISQQNLILLLWDRSPPSTLTDVTTRKTIERRSMESLVADIAKTGGESVLGKIAVLADQITRDDAFFFAELKIKQILCLPSKQSQWNETGSEFFLKLNNHLKKINEEKLSQEDLVVFQFEQSLSFWGRISDEQKMKVCDELLNTLGDNSRYSFLMAKRSLKEQKFQEAEKWYQRSMSKNPNFLEATSALADLYVLLGRHADALVLLEKLRAYNPKNFVRLTKMGQCYVSLGESSKAERLFEDALSVDEFYEDAREELGKLKCLSGEYEVAKSLLSRCKNTRKIASFLNGIGIKLVEAQKYEESIEYYRKAQYVLPGNEAAHLLLFNIGLAYSKWGKKLEAQKFARLALAREPNYAKATHFLMNIEQKTAA